MKTSTNYKTEVSHDIQYRYVCEWCGRQTPWLTKTFTGYSGLQKSGKSALSGGEKDKIHSEAISKLQSIADLTVKDGEKFGEYTELNGKCPACKKKQSWAKSRSIAVPIFLGLCGFLGGTFLGMIVVAFVQPISPNLTPAWIMGGVTSVLMFIYYMVRRSRLDKHRSALPTNKRIPEIKWNGLNG